MKICDVGEIYMPLLTSQIKTKKKAHQFLRQIRHLFVVMSRKFFQHLKQIDLPFFGGRAVQCPSIKRALFALRYLEEVEHTEHGSWLPTPGPKVGLPSLATAPASFPETRMVQWPRRAAQRGLYPGLRCLDWGF
jgi:flavin reductase (DIM6/NTAB) family NADH-FMN oxidoreductase RutF